VLRLVEDLEAVTVSGGHEVPCALLDGVRRTRHGDDAHDGGHGDDARPSTDET